MRSNPGLRPETSQNFELGTNFSADDLLRDGDKARLKLSYFHNDYKDYIMRLPGYGAYGLPYVDARYTFGNVDAAKYRGLEASGSYDAGGFFAEGSFTYYTTSNIAFREKAAPTPRHRRTIPPAMFLQNTAAA